MTDHYNRLIEIDEELDMLEKEKQILEHRQRMKIKTTYCGFCGEQQKELAVIANSAICEECVDKCKSLFKQKNYKIYDGDKCIG